MTQTSRRFSHIDTWVFDLDNTLYPHHVNLWHQVDARIGEFVSAYLKIPADEARRIQKDYYRRYGTTMRGMMTEHGVSADDYLAYVHQIDHSPLQPNPAMGAAIAKLPGRKLILTNGSTDHADKVLERLGIGSHFEAVFDIIAAELEPKPAPQTYQKFLALHNVEPKSSAMFEDLARNLVVPHQLGMTTVLVVPDGTKNVVREDWELEGRDAAHVDHVTDDLTGFLQGLGAAELSSALTSQHVVPAKAGTHSLRPIRSEPWRRTPSHPIGIGGYGSPPARGRQCAVLTLPPQIPTKAS